MKKFFYTLLASFGVIACGCTQQNPEQNDPEINQEASAPVYAKGADISWFTEMESKGLKFYNGNGFATECTALIKSLGFNSVRYRVWVDPADGWCNKADVLEKSKRAQELGLSIMIDFHYSDSWADPAQQNVPSAWKSMDAAQMTKAVADHTTDVLQTLKDNGVDVAWVQVGNETNTGMLKPLGEVSTSNKGTTFIQFANAGYEAVKAVYPEALVILHHSNAQDMTKNQWFYQIMKAGGAKYDMIGLSLYPSYWDGTKFPDWTTYTYRAMDNIQALNREFGKPVMLVEFGMPVSEPQKAKDALQYVIDTTRPWTWFKGVFYWEPESEQGRNNYSYGAFSGGKPTEALDPLKD